MLLARRVPAILVTALAVGGALVSASPGQASPGRPGGARALSSLAGHHWRHHVQVDGRAGRDSVVIVGGKDLSLDFGMGTGHITVRVHLAHRKRTVSSRQFIGYLSVRTPWTPWLGATNLDRRGGKELLVGSSTGAHAQLFTALTYHRGRLRVLEAPGGSPVWMVNSSVGTGSQGWKCTRSGVRSRSVVPEGGTPLTFRIVRNDYVRGSGRWVRTRHVVETVPGDAQGDPPASTDSFPRFVCTGLPRNAL